MEIKEQELRELIEKAYTQGYKDGAMKGHVLPSQKEVSQTYFYALSSQSKALPFKLENIEFSYKNTVLNYTFEVIWPKEATLEETLEAQIAKSKGKRRIEL